MKHSPLMRPRLVSTSILLILIAGMVYSVRPTVTAQANPQNIPDEDVPDEKETATSKGGIVEENDLIDSSKLQSVTGHVVQYQSLEYLFSPVMTPESGKRFTKFGKSASSNYVDVVEEPNSPEGFIYKQSSDRIQFGKMLQNRTAAQFTLKGEGNYKTGGGGGGGKPPHWSADVERGTSKKLKIVQTIDSYYANVGSDLPLVFEILPSEPDIKKSDVSKVQVQFLIEGKTYTFPISSLKLVEGDQVWEGRNNERERNIFTIAVDEKRFDHLSVNRGSITKKAKIRVSARVDKNRVMSEKKRLERFGDDFIPVYELGVEDSNRNGKYDIRDQLQNTKDAELDTAVFSSNSGRRFSSLNFFEFSPLFNQRKGSSTNYELFIKFDTDESFP